MKILAFLFACLFCQAIAKTWTLSPAGTNKIRTIRDQVVAGDIIEFSAGTYTTQQDATGIHGNSSFPIVIRPVSGSKVIFDGSNVAPLWYIWGSSYVSIEGFEITNGIRSGNGAGRGIDCDHCYFMNFTNLHIHHCEGTGIMVKGRDIIISNNTVHDVVLENVNATAEFGGWGEAIATSELEVMVLSERVLIENNYVYNVWGEGIDFIYCDGCVGRNNVVVDAWSNLFYIDNSRNVLLEKNTLIVTPNRQTKYGTAPTAFAIGTENHGNISVVNVTIRDNFSTGSYHTLGFWMHHGYVSQIHFVHNTIWNNSGTSIVLDACFVPGMTEGNEFSNNVISLDQNVYVADPNELASWSIFSNLWFGNDFIPLVDTIGNSSLRVSGSSPSLLFNISDSSCIQPKCFRPTFSGLLLNRGSYSKWASPTDFFGEPRSITHPSIGFAENYAIQSGDDHDDDNDDNNSNNDDKDTSESSKLFTNTLIVVVVFTLLYSA